MDRPAARAHFGAEPQAVALGLALPCLAAQRDGEARDEIFGSMLSGLQLSGAHDPDIASVLERSGDLWALARPEEAARLRIKLGPAR